MSRYEPAELAEVPNHGGSARVFGDRFFALPDDEDVGDLVSASTSIGKRSWKPSSSTMLLGALMAGVLVLTATTGDGEHKGEAVVAIAMVFAFLGLGLWLLQEAPRCSHVGTDGVRHAWKRLRTFPTSRTLRFSAAASCEVKYTRVFVRGGYQGTNLRATWRDARSRVVYEIDCGFREYRIDLDQTDIAALERHPPHTTARYALAAVDELRRYQRWSAEQEQQQEA